MENMGKIIKEARLRRNLTQERLAELLGVTAQAVSKWENAASYPDISALPELSAALGITLDELFDVTEENHFRRIEAMIEDGPELKEEDFHYCERVLSEGKNRGRCLTMLAELYNARAQYYHAKAAERAKEALTLDPTLKANHSALSEAMGGALWDWCASNHTAAIDFYKDFVAKNPDYPAGYLWLLDNLIEDGRLTEAEEYLERMKKVRDSYHVEMYRGNIAEKAGNRAEAERCWNEMVEKYPDLWFAWSARGDAWAKRAEYERAIADFREAIKRQTPPRFTDNYDSIAQICAILGDREGAIDAYEHVLTIMREDWGLTEGETVRGYEENIERLRG